ncbi:UDP-glycosyltransferase 708G1-like [Rutidosis leptorrhynchoides]|uniref:UDP-glycosyltransferase 708G1-like n=1 Tax=Rutidosis leptorrhynchoides TaxID=125765 RepID=UPI003A99E394
MPDSGMAHVALLPSAEMSHLLPILRIGASLLHQNFQVTLITVHPTVSDAESKIIARFLSAYPQVSEKKLHLLESDADSTASTDPFLLRWHAIRNSAHHLLSPLLTSMSPPVSALIYDVSLISPIIPVVTQLSIPGYVFFLSSARMFSFFVSFSTTPSWKELMASGGQSPEQVEIPSLPPLSVSLIPPAFINPKHPFGAIVHEDSPNIVKTNGILINSFENLEPDTLHALSNGTVVSGLPPVHAIGPLVPIFEFEKTESSSTNAPIIKWLDDQPPESVVFISFGSRTPMTREQIREIGDGLVKCGQRYLWVIKVKSVDRDEEDDLDKVLGKELVQRLGEKGLGLVVKDFVDQNEILAHDSTGGFLSHCGWNSVVEAVWHGVPVLAWPQGGDQLINAEVVETAGIGLWERSWRMPVSGQLIADKINEMMECKSLRARALKLREDARKGVGETTLKQLVNE